MRSHVCVSEAPGESDDTQGERQTEGEERTTGNAPMRVAWRLML